MLNVAIVGMGHIGHTHARCYAGMEGCRIAAVVDMVPEKAAEAAQRYGCPAFPTVEAMVASGLKIDAASMTTGGKENGGAHYEPTMALLRAGIPTLGEKPISNEIAKAKEMVTTARERGLPYAINLNHRFTPAARRAREWIDAGRIGPIHHVLMRLWLANPNDSAEHFHMRALHPHSLDVMRYFAGDVARVQAFFLKGEGRASWTNVQVNLLFESGALGHLLGSYDAGPGYGLELCEVVGAKARFVIEDACERLTLTHRMSKESESYAYLGGMNSFGDTFQSRIAAWVDDLRRGTPPERIDGKAEDALRAQLIIEAAIESWEKETIVSL